MNDQEFITQFEACTLPAESFHHPDHVRLAWLYLDRAPVLEALTRFTESLKRFAAANGKPGLYHETITWAFIFLINERRARFDRQHNWQEFAAANADLLDWQNNILKQYYRAETLGSEMAKRVFVMPDRSAGESNSD
ncbi:MAG: hypothetical protein U0Z53_24730 [Blastocatellia bacterium]